MIRWRELTRYRGRGNFGSALSRPSRYLLNITDIVKNIITRYSYGKSKGKSFTFTLNVTFSITFAVIISVTGTVTITLT